MTEPAAPEHESLLERIEDEASHLVEEVEGLVHHDAPIAERIAADVTGVASDLPIPGASEVTAVAKDVESVVTRVEAEAPVVGQIVASEQPKAGTWCATCSHVVEHIVTDVTGAKTAEPCGHRL